MCHLQKTINFSEILAVTIILIKKFGDNKTWGTNHWFGISMRL